MPDPATGQLPADPLRAADAASLAATDPYAAAPPARTSHADPLRVTNPCAVAASSRARLGPRLRLPYYPYGVVLPPSPLPRRPAPHGSVDPRRSSSSWLARTGHRRCHRR